MCVHLTGLLVFDSVVIPLPQAGAVISRSKIYFGSRIIDPADDAYSTSTKKLLRFVELALKLDRPSANNKCRDSRVTLVIQGKSTRDAESLNLTLQ